MPTLTSSLSREISEFIASRRSLQLATVNGQGKPHASYAPFACGSGGFYILVSELAEHTRDLLACPELSVMLIEDEATRSQIFARRRLTLAARATSLPRQGEGWLPGLDALQRRFGELVTDLSSLSDFQLFRITPVSGRYVKGFGKAYPLDGEALAGINP